MIKQPIDVEHREFADIDRHFARFIKGFGQEELPAVAAALLSRDMRLGHICLDLARRPAAFGNPPLAFAWPELKTWQKGFAKNRAIGRPDQGQPLVLDDAGRLYFRRYWDTKRRWPKIS